jgi:N-acetylneuraminic acid mutarotase
MFVLLVSCEPRLDAPATSQAESSTSRVDAGRGWQAEPVMDVARSENPAAVLEDAIYTLGGLVSSPQGMGATDTVERYQPGRAGWEAVMSLPAGRHHSMAVVHEGRLYHLGGMDNSGFNPVATSWVLGPENSWTEIAELPEPVGAGAASVINGIIYVAGGVAGGASLFAYDPSSDSWTTLAEMAQPREHTAAVALDGELWVLGGRWGPEMLSSVEIYDPVAGSWSSGPAMSEARSGFGATLIGRTIVVAGGEVFSPTKALSTTEILSEGSWMPGAPLPYPLHGVPLVTVEEVVYVIGGSTTAADVDNRGEVWSLRP